MKRFFLVLALLFAQVAAADPAADKIAAGRAALAAHDLPTAYARFEEAHALDGANQTAAAFLGLTQLFNVTEKSAAQNFMTTLGMEATGRNVYNWRASMASDEDGELVLPTNYNFAQIASFWQNTLVPESAAARANLALVTNPNFLITLSAAETRMPMAMNVDYADILMARACLRAAEFLAHLGSGQNLNLNLDTLYHVMQGDLFSLQRVLSDNPNFLTAGSTIERAAAKAALQDMIALYRQASVAIRARPAGLERLFMLDPGSLADEAGFRQVLDKIERSLTEPVQIGEKYLFTGPLFEGSWSARGVLPTFSATGADITTVPDATLGGVVVGFTKEKLAAFFTNNETTYAEMGWEWVSPKPQGNTMLRYAQLPGGKHLIMGTAGTYLTSTDGSTWSTGRITGAGQIEGIAVNGTQIVAASYDGALYLSTDSAVNWRRVYGDGWAGFHSVTYGGGRFLAVGDYGIMATSTDGESWEELYSVFDTLLDVIHTGTLFIASGVNENNGHSVIYTSPDGFNWTKRLDSSTANAYFWALAQGPDRIVAVGQNNNRAFSTDGGLNWTMGTVLPTGTVTLNDLVYANGKFVAVGGTGSAMAPSTVATSSDGITWTAASTGETFVGLFGAGVSGGTTYVFGGAGVIYTSTNNTAFTRVPGYFSTAANVINPNLFTTRAIDGKLYVGGGNNGATPATGGIILRSDDGQNFTSVSSGHGDVWDIIKQGSTFYAVGGVSASGGTSLILTSPDGATWTAQPTTYAGSVARSISYLNGQFVLTGTAGMIRTSTTGADGTWMQRITGVGTQLSGAAYGNGVYVVVGGSNNAGNPVGMVLTSPDGITWTVRNPGTNQTLRSIVFHQGVFTAVGTDGVIVRSTDGINWWWAGINGVNTILNSIAVLDGRYYVTQTTANLAGVFIETQTAVLVSSDGENWVRVLQGTTNTVNRATLFGGRIYTSHGGATIMRSKVIAAVTTPTTQVLTPDKTAQQGDALALAVNVTTDGATTYQWKKNTVDIPGANGPGLTLENIQPGAAGNYTLVVTNAAGSVTSAPIVVSVSATATAPVFLAHPESITRNVGLNAAFSVETSGTAPVTYQWVKDGMTVSNGGNVTGATTATLTFTGLTAANGGTYTVIAHNTAGDTISLPAVLTVDSTPAYNFTTLAGLANDPATTDGTGAGARFDNPHGVAVDASGNVYVSSPQSHTIRKVTSGGVVTTIAGLAYTMGTTDATGTSARFNSPRGLALNAAGTVLYVADTNNGRIRKIDLSNLAVTTLTSSAFSATALVVDASGNVYYTSYDQTVRKVDAGGTVTLFAGAANSSGTANGTGGAARFNSPMGIAMDSAGNLFVADTNNAIIRKITTPGAVVTTYAGQAQNYGYADGPADSATLSAPTGIAVDGIGNVFVTDNSSGLVRRITPGRQVTTIGGQPYWYGYNNGIGPDAIFSGPAGLAINAAGQLFFAENYNHVIRRGSPLSPVNAPTVTAPQSRTVIAGSTVTFSVTASGVSTLTYQWRHNGMDLPGKTASSLTLTNVQPGDAGSYAVLVHSVGEGDALSAPATLTVTVPPTISGQPSGQNVTLGQGISLSVTATDSGDLAYQWRRNGFAVPGAIGATLSIPTAQRDDAGVYDVVINGVGGTRISAPTLVQVAPTSYPGNLAFDATYSASPLLTISCRIFTAIALPGGKWMVGGEFVRWDSTPRTFLARLNADFSLDTTFTPPLINGFVYALGLAPDGAIYVGGEFTAVDGHAVAGLFRLNPAGALDLAWRAQDSPPNASVTALAVQPDGKPLVARASTTSGQTSTTGTTVLRRLNTDGTPDGTFSVNIVTNGQRLNAVTVEPATGKIAFAGNFSTVNGTARNGAARVDATGATLDTAFGGATGVASGATVNSMVLLASGKYLLGGTFNQVNGTTRNRAALINADGTLDAFAPVSLNGNVLGAGQQSDGKIILGGTFSTANGSNTDGIVRLTSAGAVDTLYPSGVFTSSFSTVSAARTMYVFPQANGSTAFFGSFQAALNQRRVGLAVVTAGGTLAASPAPLLYRPTYANSAFAVNATQSVVVGSIDVAGATGGLRQAVRLNDDGTLDNTFPAGTGFDPNGLSTFYIYRAVRQGDGKILAIGDIEGYDDHYAYRMVRINADGTYDDSFDAGGGPSSVLTPILPLSGGRTLLYSLAAGSTFNGQGVGLIARLNADGSRDGSFNIGTGFGVSSGNPSITAVYEQMDGKLLVAGNFNSYNGASVPAFIRLNEDGSRDTTFTPGTAQNNSIVSLAQLPDGRILAAGAFTSFNAAPVNRVVLLSATGAIDGSFTAPAGINANVGQILAQEDGKFILVGDFTGTPAPYAVRLTASGAVDSSFALRGMTGGFNSGTRIFMGDDGSIYAYSSNPVSYNNGVPVTYARFRGAPTAPTVVTPPASATVAVGDTTVFSVRAGGTGPYTYQWRRNGDNIDGATDSVLVLSDLTAGSAGNYDVIIGNSVSAVTSAPATLTVSGVSQPQTITFNTLANVGFTTTPITLTATASSGLTVTFSVVSGPASVTGNALTLTGTGTVTVRASQAGDGSYDPAPNVDRSFTVTANFASWRQDNFTTPEQGQDGLSGPNAVYGQDGLPNLVKYALGLNPKVNATSGLPEVSTTATDWVYTFTKQASATDVTCTVESSTNLTSWTTVGTLTLVSTSPSGVQTWKATVPLSTANVFFRLKVTQ